MLVVPQTRGDLVKRWVVWGVWGLHFELTFFERDTMKRAPGPPAVDDDNDYDVPVPRKRRRNSPGQQHYEEEDEDPQQQQQQRHHHHHHELMAALEEREIMESTTQIAVSPERSFPYHHPHGGEAKMASSSSHHPTSTAANTSMGAAYHPSLSMMAHPPPPVMAHPTTRNHPENEVLEPAWMEPTPLDYTEGMAFPPPISHPHHHPPPPPPSHPQLAAAAAHSRNMWAPWHPQYGDPPYYSWIGQPFYWSGPPPATSAPPMTYMSSYPAPPPSVSNDPEHSPAPSLLPSTSHDASAAHEDAPTTGGTDGSSGGSTTHAPNPNAGMWHSPIRHQASGESSSDPEEMQRRLVPPNVAIGSSSSDQVYATTMERQSSHSSSVAGASQGGGAQHPPSPPTSGGGSHRSASPPSPHGGIPLAIPSDEEHLSEYHCLVRAQIDLFAAGEADFQSNMQGRNRPIVRNQVGLRCRHCASITPPNRRPPGAVYYPSKLSGLYQAAVNMAKNHFMVSCQRIPMDVKARLARLKEKKTYMLGGGKGYWSTGGRIRNVVEVDNRLFFESCAPPPKEEEGGGGDEKVSGEPR